MAVTSTLTIIVVNWNTRELLRQCLQSLRSCRGERYRVMVIDNGSSDSSAAMVAADFPEVELLQTGENLGFARANNLGIRMSGSEFVCLLNSDTVVPEGVMESMLDFMSRHPGASACAPALRLPSGRLQTGGAGFEMSLATAFNYFFFFSKLFPFRFRGMFVEQGAYVARREAAQVDWLAGACLLVRSSAIEKAGVLDESYFMYAEDAEWCDRLREAGAIYYLPYLEILHFHGASSSKSEISTRWLDATFRYFAAKHSACSARAFRLIAACGFLLRMSLYALLALLRPEVSANRKAMYRYLRFSVTGK